MSTWPPSSASGMIGQRFPQNLEEGGPGRLPFSFHDSTEIGPAMLAKISKKTGLQADDL